MSTAITTIQVAASTDDARTNNNTWPATANHNATGTNSVIGQYPAGAWTMVGARFLGVPVPQGATIESASVSFQSNSDLSGSLVMAIAAEDVDDAATFGDAHTTYDAYSAKTTAVAEWTVGAWTTGNWFQSADISTVIQEIVDREGWASGNDIVLLFYAKNSSQSGYRRPRLYDYAGNASGPKLDITYSADAAGPPAMRRYGGVPGCAFIQHNNPPIKWG